MLTRKEFRKYINFIIAKEKANDEINNVMRKYDDVFIDWITPIDNSSGYIADLINIAMGNRGIADEKTLSYWLWEGRIFENEYRIGDIKLPYLPTNHKYSEPDIGNVDKLYEYLAWTGEYDSKIKWISDKPITNRAEHGDIVTFTGKDGKLINGTIEVVDKNGTAGRPGVLSYDIFVFNEMRFYKHIPAKAVYKNDTNGEKAISIANIPEKDRAEIEVIDCETQKFTSIIFES